MSKETFTEDWPVEEGYYLFPEPVTDGVIAFRINMKDNIPYVGNTPLDYFLEYETLKLFWGPMSKEECKQRLKEING